MRTDENNNPAAITCDVAKQGGLVLGVDYVTGTQFPGNKSTEFTARLLGDPVLLTIKVIDKIGYYTKTGAYRWTYIAMTSFVWRLLSDSQKRDVIGFHYLHEGGITMRGLFPNYGKF